MEYSRKNIAQLIVNRLSDQKEDLSKQYVHSKNRIGYFFIDDLLPQVLAKDIYSKFPSIKDTIQRKSIREYKSVAYQINKYDDLLKEVIYAFQEKKVVEIIEEICGVKPIMPDEYLYAGGLSLMEENNFLNPHLDNSHDKERNCWRVFNLLYYVTPNWELKNGGNLELWPNGLKDKPVIIESKFNRLVLNGNTSKLMALCKQSRSR